MNTNVTQLLEHAVSLRIGSGAAAAWGRLGGTIQTAVAGTHSHFTQTPITEKSIFDLASLTKILAMTSLFMKWSERGLDLRSPVPGKSFSFYDVLTHSSGLPAWKPFYETLKTVPVAERRKKMFELAQAVDQENQVGKQITYSDIGPLLLTSFAEKTTGKSWNSIIQSEVFDPLGSKLHYRNVNTGVKDPMVVATEICPWRGLLQGEVHDDNTWMMGGASAHAGVFGSLSDVVGWVQALMDGKLVSMATLQKFSQPFQDSTGARRAVGFDMPSLDGSSTTGNVFSRNTIGHLGFTGTSLWIDLDDGRFAVLLTNRVHPSRNDLRIRDLRIAFHSVAF